MPNQKAHRGDLVVLNTPDKRWGLHGHILWWTHTPAGRINYMVLLLDGRTYRLEASDFKVVARKDNVEN